MRNFIFATIVSIASSNVQAGGFAPWPDPTSAGKAEATSSQPISPASFYSAGLPKQTDRIDSKQADITIVPYYLAAR